VTEQPSHFELAQDIARLEARMDGNRERADEQARELRMIVERNEASQQAHRKVVYDKLDVLMKAHNVSTGQKVMLYGAFAAVAGFIGNLINSYLFGGKP